MGQIFGVFARSIGRLIIDSPLNADEDSYYSLANIFMDPENYMHKILENVDIEQGRKDWLQLSTEEIKALLYNNIMDFADEEIEYRISVNEPMKKDFHAIGMAYDENKGEIVYSPKYMEFENWSPVFHMLSALNKIREVLYMDLKVTIGSKMDSDYVRYSFENILTLLGIINTLKKTGNIDEVALVLGPY
jgi:hypothetical protein